MAGGDDRGGIHGSMEKVCSIDVPTQERVECRRNVPRSIVERPTEFVDRLGRIIDCRAVTVVRHCGEDEPLTRQTGANVDVSVGRGSPSRRKHHQLERSSGRCWFLIRVVETVRLEESRRKGPWCPREWVHWIPGLRCDTFFNTCGIRWIPYVDGDGTAVGKAFCGTGCIVDYETGESDFIGYL